jgi:hypothetical protein
MHQNCQHRQMVAIDGGWFNQKYVAFWPRSLLLGTGVRSKDLICEGNSDKTAKPSRFQVGNLSAESLRAYRNRESKFLQDMIAFCY